MSILAGSFTTKLYWTCHHCLYGVYTVHVISVRSHQSTGVCRDIYMLSIKRRFLKIEEWCVHCMEATSDFDYVLCQHISSDQKCKLSLLALLVLRPEYSGQTSSIPRPLKPSVAIILNVYNVDIIAIIWSEFYQPSTSQWILLFFEKFNTRV